MSENLVMLSDIFREYENLIGLKWLNQTFTVNLNNSCSYILENSKIDRSGISLGINYYNTKKTEISPNFLVWKFCRKAQFAHRNPLKLCRNCVFPQNSHTSKLAEILVYFAVLQR